MANKDLITAGRLQTATLGQLIWYEETDGLALDFCSAVDRMNSSFLIPWKEVRAALKRKDK